MGQLIDELGLLGYLLKYPVNPISIIATVVLIGIIVLIVNHKVLKSKATRYLVEYPGSAIVTLFKRKQGNDDYGDHLTPIKLNGERAHWFFVKPMAGAIYMRPGHNQIEIYTQWARGTGASTKFYSSPVTTLSLEVTYGGHYSLEYYIPEDRYIFEPFFLT
jgi:hypothetical protein